MFEFLFEYGLFLLKAITVLVVILIIIGAAVAKKKSASGELKITNLNKKYLHLKEAIQEATLDKKALKQENKAKKKKEKAEKKASNAKTDIQVKPRLFVIEFEGDIKASSVPSLREEVTAILAAANSNDEILVNLNNSGGVVHEHGLAASQLVRIKQANLPLTVAVDKVAASGGYMMACVADKILAAPFAIVGSIGVVAQLPNFHRLLDKAGVDFEQHTAGEYKRNVTMFGKNTDKERQQLKEQLEDIHDLFRGFVTDYRPSLDMKEVGTGQYWYGSRAKELMLVDEIMTSDDYLSSAANEKDIFHIQYEFEKTLMEKMSNGGALLFDKVISRLSRPE
ncbi:MAG: protease SohB [Arenicella sp.]